MAASLGALAACSSSSPSPSPSPSAGGREAGSAPAPTTTTSSVVPAVEDVYAVPDPLPAGEPGDVIQVEELGEGRWRVLYHSESVAGADIAVSGLILRPPGAAPPGGFPVVSWAHGTTGTADRCAPSKLDDPWIPSVDALLDAGYVVVATDYEGLGTPGLHPYLLGESEGRGVLDIVRAAQRLDGVDAGSDVVVWGHSQGGHAAMFAGELAPAYAPELDVHGVVAFAPVGDLLIVGTAALGADALFPLAFMLLGTWAEQFPELDLTELLSPAALELLPLLDEVCAPDLVGVFRGRTIAEMTATGSPMEVEPLAELLSASSIGGDALEAPVLVAHGEADELVPLALSELLLPTLCAAGSPAELRTYPVATHGSILFDAAGDALAWTADRFAGRAVSGGCASP